MSVIKGFLAVRRPFALNTESSGFVAILKTVAIRVHLRSLNEVLPSNFSIIDFVQLMPRFNSKLIILQLLFKFLVGL